MPRASPRPQERHRHGHLALFGAESEQAGGRHRGADRPAHSRGVPPPVVERRVAGGGDGGRDLVALGVGVERVLQRQPEVPGDHERRRRDGRADMGDTVGQGVVEVEHVTGGGGERDDAHEVSPA